MQIIHNPGTIPDEQLHDPRTDVTIVFEGSFRAFEQRTRELASLPHLRTSYGIMVHSVPKGHSLGGLVQTISRRAKYLFVTNLDTNYYQHFAQNWLSLARIMASS